MSEDLNYAGGNVATARKVRDPSRLAIAWITTLLVLAALAITICARIEVLNSRADNILPRDLTKSPGKWRGSFITSESRWRELHSKILDPTLATRPLTPAEAAIMEHDIYVGQNTNELRGLVGSWGLLLYLLIPFLIVALPITLLCGSRRFLPSLGMAIAFIGVIACALAVNHGAYFASLGW